jgi:glycosyltransferase involved in cell wall biosynthesis
MRLVIDCRYLGAQPSGIGSYLRALITRLPDLAPDIPIRLWVGTDIADLDTQRVQVHRVSSRPNSFMTLAGPWALDHLRPDDLFHAPANILGFGLPCPSVVTVHDLMWLDRPDDCQPTPYLRPISRAFFCIGIRRAMRLARRIFTVSSASARAIERAEPSVAGRVVVTHNAYEPCFQPPPNPQAVRGRAARILGFGDDYLLVVGQNQRTKGHEIALRAFADAEPGALKLVLVQRLSPGEGLAELALRLGVGDRVRFVAQLELDELVTILQGARALLQPSYAEGFGLPALEAAACGCPVVASDIPPLREVLGDAALFVQSGAVKDWAAAIGRVATDAGLRAILCAKGVERARCFSWDRTARATLQAYREVFAELGSLRG